MSPQRAARIFTTEQEQAMPYYQCQCGARDHWSDAPPPPCAGCGACGTTFAQGGVGHASPEPHQMVPFFNTLFDRWDGGKCEVCGTIDRNWVNPEA